MRGVLQIPKVEALNASLQCSSSNKQSGSTHAKHNSIASSKKRKSHLEPSVPLLRHVPTGRKDLVMHVPTGLNDLLRHVPTGLTDLLRHMPTGLKDLLMHVPTD